MNTIQFCRDMIELGCSETQANRVLRLVYRLGQSYPSVNLENLLVLSLEMVPRGLSTYQPDRPASLTTHLITVVRNACISMLKKEELQRRRFGAMLDDSLDIADDTNPPALVSFEDSLDELSKVLSPFAWRMLQLILASAPVTLSYQRACETLGLSAAGVYHLREEIRYAAGVVIESSDPEKVGT